MPKAKYEDIYRDLKEKIEDKTYSYEALLPSENTLVTVYSCSRNTIRRALQQLIEEGYVQAIHGKGVRVLYRAAEKANFTVGGIESFHETAQRNRLKAITKVIEFSNITIGEELAAGTGLPAGKEAYRIRRVRYLNGKALILDKNIFVKELVPGLTAEIAGHSIYEYIEGELQMQIATSKRKITVERATKEDRQLLELGGYDCLAIVTGQTFNAHGILFEYTQSRHHPDYFCFQDTATRKSF